MRPRFSRSVPAVALLLALPGGALLVPAQVSGQDPDSIRSRFLIREPPPFEAAPPVTARTTPGLSASSPIAFGASWGTVFIGAGFQERARYIDDVDGSIAGGFGLGDPVRFVGVEVVGISFSTFRSGFFSRSAVDMKVHRILPWQMGIAFGWEGVLVHGDTDSGRNHYAVLSKWYARTPDESAPFSQFMFTVGVGDGRYHSEDDWAADKGGVNPFGSVGVRILAPVALVADWTGQDLFLAASIAPFPRLGFVISPGLADVTGSAGDGVRFLLTAGFGYHFGGGG